MVATNWIYQFSIISFLCTILSSPFNAAIIAREKMGVYAYVSIAESLLKLALIYSILILGGDKLIIYGFFMMLVAVSVFIFYMAYCLMNFEETKYRYVFDKNKIKRLLKIIVAIIAVILVVALVAVELITGVFSSMITKTNKIGANIGNNNVNLGWSNIQGDWIYYVSFAEDGMEVEIDK